MAFLTVQINIQYLYLQRRLKGEGIQGTTLKFKNSFYLFSATHFHQSSIKMKIFHFNKSKILLPRFSWFSHKNGQIPSVKFQGGINIYHKIFWQNNSTKNILSHPCTYILFKQSLHDGICQAIFNCNPDVFFWYDIMFSNHTFHFFNNRFLNFFPAFPFMLYKILFPQSFLF